MFPFQSRNKQPTISRLSDSLQGEEHTIPPTYPVVDVEESATDSVSESTPDLASEELDDKVMDILRANEDSPLSSSSDHVTLNHYVWQNGKRILKTGIQKYKDQRYTLFTIQDVVRPVRPVCTAKVFLIAELFYRERSTVRSVLFLHL